MARRLASALSAPLLAVIALLVGASPAQPEPPADKPRVLSGWTQTSAGSYAIWVAARGNQSQWSAYGFDWSTDYCTSSPDNPLRFPFKISCARHDFGYRNYKKEGMGTFRTNKPRLDRALYEDLKRVCKRYSGVKWRSCRALAWTYYQAVKKLGRTGLGPPARARQAFHEPAS